MAIEKRSERTVLVTAVGGAGIGEQLIKSLRIADRPYRIVGADAQARSLGLQDVDVPVILPLAAAPDYVDTILDVCQRLGVQAVYPGSEAELGVLSKARSRLVDAGIVLFANTEAVVATGLDKAATVRFLADHGFRWLRSVLVASPADLSTVDFLPAILKPNSGGGGSVNTFVAQTEDEFRLFGTFLLATYPSFLAQEYVGTAFHEYTVGVLSDLDGVFINSIAVRRNIMSVFSNRSRVKNRTGNPMFGDELVVSNGVSQGEIGPFPEVTAVCERMALELGSRGPLNIQCRLVGSDVFVFEINPRFSGTAPLRALVGFNEPDLLFRRHVEGEVLSPRFSYRTGHIARGLREVLLDSALEGATIGAGDFVWEIPSLPFIYRPLETPHNDAALPDSLPFTVVVTSDTGLVQQRPNPVVADALEKAYAIGSEIPGRMEDKGIGREYADDFLDMLAQERGTTSFDGKSVLEIGCGNGYLLSRIQACGARVQGIEPGAHGLVGGSTYSVPITQGFFPTPDVTGSYDLVILYLVLEHLPDPTKLLTQIKAQLNKGGQVAVVVPDAESFLNEGDVSTLFHEHYSYFTAATLASSLRRSGANGIRVRRSKLSKLLFALFSFDSSQPDDVAFDASLVASLALAHRFRTSVNRTATQLAGYLAQARAMGETVAVYVPGRFVNYVRLGGLSLDGVRFFDDSPAMQNRYYPGIAIPVEGEAQLRARPCARVLIMSTSFGAKIKARLASTMPASTDLCTLDELLHERERTAR